MKKIIVPIIVLLFILLGVYVFLPKNEIEEIREPLSPIEKNEPVDITESEEEEEVETDMSESSAPKYENTEYGFELTYPETCEALDDEDNLYGWPNGIVLFYCGGQVYGVAVEVWDTEEEFQEKYPSGNYVSDALGDKYITVVDLGNTETTFEIMSSFEILD